MGFPDTLLGYIDGLEGLLQTLIDAQCCVAGSPVADLYTDDWESGDPVPQNVIDAGYATGTTDQTGYSAYKCMVSHVAVQDLIEKVERMAGLLEDEAATLVGGVGAVVSLLAFVLAAPTLGVSALALEIVVGIGVATNLVQFFVSYGKTASENLAVSLQDIYEELACAIYQADGNVAALAAAKALITSEIGATEAAALEPVLGSVIDALYAGRYNQTNTAQSLADAGFETVNFSCECTFPEATTLFAVDALTSPNNFPNGFVDNTGPWLETYTEYSHTRYSQESQGRNLYWKIHDDAGLNNPETAPASWKVKATDWAVSGYTMALRWYNGGTLLETRLNADFANGTWYTAPANATRALLTTSSSSTPTFSLMVIEQ